MDDDNNDTMPSSPAASAANLSLAEMSRMEEALLSQTSHHEEEEERQRRKAEKREKRARGIIKAKQPDRRERKEYNRAYRRFKYRKGTDMSQEMDVGGSMEYLMRKKLSQQSEQKRLMEVTRTREAEETRKREDEEGMLLQDDGDVASDQWPLSGRLASSDAWQSQGYVTMPQADADKLPYYIYRNSRRRVRREGGSVSSKTSADDDDDRDDDDDNETGGGHRNKRRKTQNTTTTASGQPSGSSRKRKGQGQRIVNPFFGRDNAITRSFPLHFKQPKAKMDLHAMIDMTKTLGSDRMVISHGRNAKRLWTRMVAGGVMNNDNDGSQNVNDDVTGTKVREEDDDSISNVSSSSSSSQSSTHSYQPTGVYSQMSYGTSVVGMKNDNDAVNSPDGAKQNSMIRLMSMVHSLPNTTHRHKLLMRIAQEMGTSRRLWEDEMECWVEGADSTREEDVDISNRRIAENIPPKERWAVKSFLGVDATISSPPCWTTDMSNPTQPLVLKKRLAYSRSSLLRRFRQRIKTQQKKYGTSPDSGKNVDDTSTSAGSAKKSSTKKVNDQSESVEIKEGEGAEGTSDEIEKGKPDDEMDISSAANESDKLLGLVIDKLQKDTDAGGVDKYAKILHESNIDVSNIGVSLAFFMRQLTSSKARLREIQQMDSPHFQHHHALKLAEEDVGYWHESIVSYLTLAETLNQGRDVNFYKSGNDYPQIAPLAQAVMATQSYLANGGGLGCGRKKQSLPPSSWEVKDENHSSDESEVGDTADNDQSGNLTQSNLKSTLNDLEKAEMRGILLAASDLAKRGKGSFANKHLTSFASIHLTTGIAMIAGSLTSKGAELISRPCCPDSADYRTPFDLMNKMITLIEGDGSLISPPHSSCNSKGKIIDEMLLQSMQEAADVFWRCVEKDPQNVDNWSWYVSTLLGMLCIAFGSIETGNGEMKSERMETLESFSEIRNRASVALTVFVKFALCYGCPMFHFAVASMLEWRRAVFLLHRSTNDEFGLDVRRLHAYNTYQWATKTCCSKTSIARVHLLCESKHLPRNSLLDILARAIEQNPCDKENWARFVKMLGAVPTTSVGTHCLHKKPDQSSETEREWWGKDRVTEWTDEFFYAPKSSITVSKSEVVREISAAVDSALSSNHLSSGQDIQHNASNSHGNEAVTFPKPSECMDWIRNPADDNASDDVYDVDLLMNDALLPANTAKVASNSSSGQLLLDSEIGDPSCEALCMKIVVACHLVGLSHPFVCDSIWWLAVELWQSTHSSSSQCGSGEKNPYAGSLRWLSKQGLIISSYLQCQSKRVAANRQSAAQALTQAPGPSPKERQKKANSQNSPAEAPWFYVDLKGRTQGPFDQNQMSHWFRTGCFKVDLRIGRGRDGPFRALSSYDQQDPFARHV